MLNATEIRYSAYERTMLGIVVALGQWKHYFEGPHPIVIQTNHAPWRHLPDQTSVNRRVWRWILSYKDTMWKLATSLVSRCSRIQSDLTDPATSDTVGCRFALIAAKYNSVHTHCGCLNSVPRSKKATRQNTQTQHVARTKKSDLLQESRYNNLRNLSVLTAPPSDVSVSRATQPHPNRIPDRSTLHLIVASVCFTAAEQPRLSTPGKFCAYVLQNKTSLLQSHNR